MRRLVAILLTLCLLVSGCGITTPEVTAPLPETSDGLAVHYLDVGQADCILLECDSQTMLIDGGNVDDSDLVVAYLLQQGISRLDYVVCTHAHEDHVGGLPGVLAVFEAGTVWCSMEEYDSKCFRDFLYYADQQELTPVCPDPGSAWSLGSTEITVLGPVWDYDDANNMSIVLHAQYGETSFLFTGDAERDAELDILEAGFDVSATVLKAGHHGSSTSSSYQWLRAVNADYAVIPVGTDNAYGHPHEEVLSRFRDANMEVYRTDLQGHIVCRSDGKNLTFTTDKSATVTNPTAYDGSGQQAQAETFIGNKNSKKFHLPTCSGLPAEKNQVVFSTYDEAVEKGYAPCGNCMG